MVEKIYTIDEIRERLYPLFDSVPVVRAVLFGSYARNEATAKSDIDLFIDTGGRLCGLKLIGYFEELEERAEKPVDAIEAVDLDSQCDLFQTIQTEGITIYGE